MNTIKKLILPTLIALSALAVSGSAAFYSVYGLSKLFAGASLAVIIMAGALEVSKLVTASLLYQYWDKLNKVLRAYLVTAVITLVLITSMGIYGFLSSAYQTTYSELLIIENDQQFLEQKASMYQEDIIRYDQELQSILTNIGILSQARSSQTQVRDENSSTGIRTVISTADLRAAQSRIKIEEENRALVQQSRQTSLDSLRSLQQQILLLNNSSQASSELGPLQYLSGLTGYPMDKIINILLLVIIFVFDPLAIALVVAANFAFQNSFPKKEENLYGEIEDDFSEWDDLEELEELLPDPPTKEQVEKMNSLKDEILKKSNLYNTLDKIGSPKIKEKYDNLEIIEADKINKMEVIEPTTITPPKKDFDEEKLEPSDFMYNEYIDNLNTPKKEETTDKGLESEDKEHIFKNKIKNRFNGGNIRVKPKSNDDNIIDYN